MAVVYGSHLEARTFATMPLLCYVWYKSRDRFPGAKEGAALRDLQQTGSSLSVIPLALKAYRFSQ